VGRSAIELAAEVVTSFVSHNSVPRSDLSELFQAVHDRLKRMEIGAQVEPAEPKTPAVPIRKSVTPDYLICLDDGRKLKSLRRHLAMLHMTPEEYGRSGACLAIIRWSRQTTRPCDLLWLRKWVSGRKPKTLGLPGGKDHAAKVDILAFHGQPGRWRSVAGWTQSDSALRYSRPEADLAVTIQTLFLSPAAQKRHLPSLTPAMAFSSDSLQHVPSGFTPPTYRTRW